MRNAINQADGLHAEALFSQKNHCEAVYVIRFLRYVINTNVLYVIKLMNYMRLTVKHTTCRHVDYTGLKDSPLKSTAYLLSELRALVTTLPASLKKPHCGFFSPL